MTSAAELVRLATAFRARLWVENDQLELDAPADFPVSLIQLLRVHKVEVLEYLIRHPQHDLRNHRLKYPILYQAGDQELAEIFQTVQQQGSILVWSTTLSDLVAFYRWASDLHNIPPGFVTYSTQEMAVLFSQDADLSTESLRLIHEVKKYGGQIVDGRAGDLQ